jgi:hypothetical protein
MTTWTRDRVADLGPVTNVPTLARILDVHPDTVYERIRREDWTMTRVLRMGRKIRIPTRDVIDYLFGAEIPAEPAVPSPSNHAENQQLSAVQSQSQCGCSQECEPAPRLRGA